MAQARHLHSIDAGHYKNTAGCATEVMPVPAIVKISMSQNLGAPCQPLVKKGDVVKVGTKIGENTEAFLTVPVHSSVSGTVSGIETMRNAMGGMDTYVCIESDGKQEVEEGIAPPVINQQSDFIEAVKNSGLVGLGGAAFPAWIKFNPKNLDEIKYLIVNGAECEPFITSDHRTMLEDTQYVINAVVETMKWLTAEEGYIAIEDNKQDAIDLFDKVLQEQGITNVKTFPLQARYPKGAERVLIYEVTGQECKAGVLPASLGVIVSNITSMATLGKFLETGMPLVSKRVTIDGDAVAKPGNVLLPIGTQIHDAIEFCGGYKTPPTKILMGGPMMGRSVFSDRMTIVKNNNAILAFSKEQALIPEETACISCGRCHEACPFNLLPTGYADAYLAGDAKRLEDLQVMQCMECGSCSFVCPAHRPLVFYNKLGKGLVREAQNARK